MIFGGLIQTLQCARPQARADSIQCCAVSKQKPRWLLSINPLLGPDFTLSTIALILSILDWLATTILLPQMLFSNFDFLQQNFAVISKTFLDNSDSATVSVLSHSGPARTLKYILKSFNLSKTHFITLNLTLSA